MNKKNLYWIIPLCLIVGISLGFIGSAIGNNYLMEDYDLYNCIYNNADDNGFSKNPYLIHRIQNECICFREYNYTNLLEVDC